MAGLKTLLGTSQQVKQGRVLQDLGGGKARIDVAGQTVTAIVTGGMQVAKGALCAVALTSGGAFATSTLTAGGGQTTTVTRDG